MTGESATERDTIEELADSFITRFRAGERPSVDEFVLRFPDLADELRELLPALVLLEQNASPDITAAFSGAASHGPMPRDIGEFTILREIARGGMGVVYEAIQQSLGRHVALKVLASPGLLNPTHLERFRLEARAAARLHHTHIVPVFGVGEHGGLHYYAMQFIQGQSLDLVIDALSQIRGPQQISSDNTAAKTFVQSVADGMLTGQFRADADDSIANVDGPIDSQPSPSSPAKTDSPLSASAATAADFTSSHSGREFYRSVARVGWQVAEALAYAHSEGILHRDIKPSNLLLDARGNVWVTDFGLAQAEGTEGLTQTGDFVGTLRYMPPERLEGWSDRRSDLYSLGATLYELLTLRPFLESDTRGQLVDKILHESPPPPSKFDRSIPRDLETIILKAIGKEPAIRYRTAQEMADDLERFLADRPVMARRSTPVEQLMRWCRRNPIVAGLLLAVATTLMLGIVASSYFAASASRAANAAVQSRDDADRQRQRAELVNKFFMDEVFGQADPNVFKRAGISLVEALNTAAKSIGTKFPDDPELQAMLQTRLGEIYSAMDEQEKAVAQLEPAAKLWKQVAGDLDPRTLSCRSYLGTALSKCDHRPEARAVLVSTLADQTKVLGATHLDTFHTAISLGFAMMEARDETDVQQIESTYRQALAALGPRHPTTLESEYNLAWALRWRRQQEQARIHAQSASEGLRATVGSDDIRAMFASYNYAACLQLAGEFDQAAAELRQLLEVRKRVLGPSHIDTVWTYWRLTRALSQGRHSDEAAATFNELMVILSTRKLPDQHRLMAQIAALYITFPHTEDRYIKQAVEMANRACELTNFTDLDYIDTLADACAETGDSEAALKWSRKIAEMPASDIAEHHYNSALRFLWCGSSDEYRRICAAMSKQFENSTDEQERYRVVWASTLGQGAIDDFSVPTKLIRDLLEKNPANPTYLVAQGILDYRAETFAEAATHLTAAIAACEQDAARRNPPLYARFFLAMTNWKLGYKEEAQKQLAAAQAEYEVEMKTLPVWNRRLTYDVFRREAEALIQPAKVSAELTK